jgi:hypothetical protein
MSKIVGPEGCMSYFEYDGNDNLTQVLDSDNYRTYFAYQGGGTGRLTEVNAPEGAGLYFSYDDSVPQVTNQTAMGGSTSQDYQWDGKPVISSDGTISL